MNQAECDELAQRAEALKEENASLRAELSRIRSEYEKIVAQNAALKVWGFCFMLESNIFCIFQWKAFIQKRCLFILVGWCLFNLIFAGEK